MASDFLSKVVPLFQKYGSQYKFHIISFAIAQACYESGYGDSYAAKNYNNILGIGPHKYYSSWDACVKGYYTDTVLGGMDEARNATTLDQYYQAFVKSNYCPGTEAQYYSAIRSIIGENNLTKYDAKSGQSLATSTTNKLQEFLNVAAKHSNETFFAWTAGMLGISGYQDWCAHYICACAKEVGVLNKVIAQSGWVRGIMEATANNCGGKLYNASGYSPRPGDMVCWKRPGELNPYHVAIVNTVSGRDFETFEGNHVNGGSVNSKSARVNHSLNESLLYQFCHPNWESVGGYSDGSAGGIVVGGGPLYSSEYTRADALVREVGYIDSNSERTIDRTGIHLSVMNYTSMLADLWGMFGWSTGEASENSSDTSQLSGSVKTVVDYLMKKGLNAAAACGVAGNIYYESNFNTSAVGDGGTSFGICQWHEGRGDAMKSYVGSGWASNLTGQLEYLWHELNTNYTGTLNKLKSVSNTESGTKNAADYFVRNFEVPADVNNESLKRQAKAVEYFSKIQSGGAVSDGTLTNKQKAVINSAKTTPTPGLNLCAAWVTNVFTNAGIGTWYGNAVDLYERYCIYQNKSQLKPGMIIAVGHHDNTYMGSIYGHIGIYIGDNKLMHNVGSIATTGVDDWINRWETRHTSSPAKWGWMGNADLTK